MDHKSQVGKLPVFSRQLKWNDCFSTAPGTNAWLPIFQKKTFFHRRSSLSDPSVWKIFVPKKSYHLVAHGASELGSWYGVSKAKDTELMTMTKRTTSGEKTRDSCVENVIWLHHVRGEWKKHQPTHGFHWLHRRVWRGSWHFTAWLQLKTISRF